MAELFQYLVVLLLAVWTARLAVTKGRNGWAWGGVALILGLLPWHLIGVLPVLALMFIKQPNDSSATQPDQLSCARCAKLHSEGQHFCTGCGWDLKESYFSKEPEKGQPFSSPAETPSTAPSIEVGQRQEPAEAPINESESVLEEVDAPSDDGTPEPALETLGEAPENEHIPWGTYDVGVAPTAAAMVSRGIERFDNGKFQEAIDQFTKAIALDPNYADAWEHRSEAYAQLGRPKQAEDDRRHLQGLDPSSSPG